MKLFKNKFFIVCLCIAVAVAGLSSVFSLMGYRALARDIVGTVTMPVRLVAAAFTNAADGFSKYFTSVNALSAQKDALEKETPRCGNSLSARSFWSRRTRACGHI